MGCPSPPSTSATPGAADKSSTASSRERSRANCTLAASAWPTYTGTHTGRGGTELGRVEDLATLVHELPLLARVAGFLHRTRERNDVARDRDGPIDRRARPVAGGAGAAQALQLAGALGPLLVELAHTRLPGTRHRLVGGHDHALDPGGAMERRQRRDQDHGGAVGARHDPCGSSRRSSGLTSLTTSGTAGSMRNAAELSTTARRPPLRGAPTRARGDRRRRSPRCRGRRSSRRASTSHATSPPANGSLRPSERADAYARSSLTGNSRSSSSRSISVPTNPVAPTTPTRAPLAARSNAACSARTARSTSSSCTTHEMRMVDVEIISMLTFSAARVSNICAATPGFVRIPAPTNDTRPMAASKLLPPASMSTTTLSTISLVRANSSRGTVNEMSVWSSVETFCSIMSTLTLASASARNSLAAMPGRSGTRKMVTLASEVSWVTPR